MLNCNLNKTESASLSESCSLLLKEDLPDRVIKHSYMVALGALRLGIALSNNKKINLDYHICGGILHDIHRLHKDHSLKGKEFLWSLGLKNLAYIVGAHTILPKNILENMQIYLQEENIESEPSIEQLKRESDFKISSECVHAAICVYLSDKLFCSDKFVNIEGRFSGIKNRFAHDALTLKAVKKREKVTLAVYDWFYKETKIQASACVQKESGHELEIELRELLKYKD